MPTPAPTVTLPVKSGRITASALRRNLPLCANTTSKTALHTHKGRGKNRANRNSYLPASTHQLFSKRQILQHRPTLAKTTIRNLMHQAGTWVLYWASTSHHHPLPYGGHRDKDTSPHRGSIRSGVSHRLVDPNRTDSR